jgi:hypothetical protein
MTEAGSTLADETKWELLARQDLSKELLYRFYERAGIYQYTAGMSEEDADRRAFMEVVRSSQADPQPSHAGGRNR